MKKLKFFILLFIFNCTLFIVNAQYVYFNKRIDITGDYDVCRGIIPFNNGYLVAGGHGPGEKIYLSYLDSLGEKKWYKTYTQSGYNYFFGLSGSLLRTKDKYIAICGARAQYYGWGILIKVDSLGNKKWEREYTILYNNNINSGNISKDSGYILTGSTRIESSKDYYLLLKTDSLGNMQWYKTYTDNHPKRNYAGKSVIETPDKGYCLGGGGGYWSEPGSNYCSIVEIIKTDSLGNQQWKKTYGNPLFCNGMAMLSLSKDSNIIATYSLGFSDINADNMQNYITKIGLDGEVKWDKKIGRLELDNWPAWIQTLSDGSFIIGGNNYVKDTSTKHIGWLFKLNSNGDSLWYREYAKIQGVNEGNELWQVTSTSDGGYAAAGSLFPEVGNGGQDIWVFKTDSLGCLVPNCTGIGFTEFNPNAGAQMLVYPNPFKETFAINYSIPKEGKKAVFELRDVMGNLVYSTALSNNVKQLQVVAGSLKAGVYIARLLVDGVMVTTEKIIKN